MQRQHVLRTDFFVSGQNKKLARKTLEKPQVRASRVQEHLHSWQPRTPPDAHNRQSHAKTGG